jgi:hypothetical protein
MGFRIRKSFKLAPGVRMTISNSGVSYSAGVRGARITKTARGNVTGTARLPGSGIFYTTSIGNRSNRSRKAADQVSRARSGFVNLIRADGILPHYSTEKLVTRAERICSELTEGTSPSAVLISEILSGEFITSEKACMFVKRAVVSFCPRYIDQVLAAANGDPEVRRAAPSR